MLRGDLPFASVQGEEDGGLGTYATLDRGWRADACVIPEPTSLDLVPANGGSLTFRLRVHGLASHAARRTSGVSAIEKFWPVFRALRRLEAERNTVTDPLMSRWEVAYPIEVGILHSGNWSSSVPDLRVAEGRYGVALDEAPSDAREQLVTAGADQYQRAAVGETHDVSLRGGLKASEVGFTTLTWTPRERSASTSSGGASEDVMISVMRSTGAIT